jgi:hypothetical protein
MMCAILLSFRRRPESDKVWSDAPEHQLRSSVAGPFPRCNCGLTLSYKYEEESQQRCDQHHAFRTMFSRRTIDHYMQYAMDNFVSVRMTTTEASA